MGRYSNWTVIIEKDTGPKYIGLKKRAFHYRCFLINTDNTSAAAMSWYDYPGTSCRNPKMCTLGWAKDEAPRMHFSSAFGTRSPPFLGYLIATEVGWALLLIGVTCTYTTQTKEPGRSWQNRFHWRYIENTSKVEMLITVLAKHQTTEGEKRIAIILTRSMERRFLQSEGIGSWGDYMAWHWHYKCMLPIRWYKVSRVSHWLISKP